ncbi:MAG: hypothetical protein VX642_06790, partial [Bdellovibrionota bacterium]|nr:hypothetical protein [Bdellovibrionota bacterium]
GESLPEESLFFNLLKYNYFIADKISHLGVYHPGLVSSFSKGNTALIDISEISDMRVLEQDVLEIEKTWQNLKESELIEDLWVNQLEILQTLQKQISKIKELQNILFKKFNVKGVQCAKSA